MLNCACRVGSHRYHPAACAPSAVWITLIKERMFRVHDCRQVAEYILTKLDKSLFQGVCFFTVDTKQWTVLDFLNCCLPLSSSPTQVCDTFVVFDDARCRGVDHKLRQSAVGLLSLGPKTTKDKMMQAAGRLRQLGRHQTLHFVSTPDVTSKIQLHACNPAAPVTSLQVLDWVMSNTVQATQQGVMEWANQGLHFATTHGAPQRALVDEVLTLEALYGGTQQLQGIGDAVQGVVVAKLARCSGADALPWRQVMLDKIQAQSAEFGAGHEVIFGGQVDDECERELELVQEKEVEQEREVAKVLAA